HAFHPHLYDVQSKGDGSNPPLPAKRRVQSLTTHLETCDNPPRKMSFRGIKMQELVQSFKKAEGELLTTEEQFGQPHKIKYGTHQEYYATGQLMREGMIIDGKRDGTWAVFEKDGSK